MPIYLSKEAYIPLYEYPIKNIDEEKEDEPYRRIAWLDRWEVFLLVNNTLQFANIKS
jgi:hypothetical protein